VEEDAVHDHYPTRCNGSRNRPAMADCRTVNHIVAILPLFSDVVVAVRLLPLQSQFVPHADVSESGIP